jgi:hypothetical protein
MSTTKRFPTFINNSGLPINLETWQKKMEGLHSLNEVLVKSDEQVIFPSTTGEWYLQNCLYNKEDVAEWIAAKMKPGYRVGKFRDEPCASGNYSWMNDDAFDILYDKEKNTATFVRK